MQTWVYVMVLMIAGNFLLRMVPLFYFVPAVFLINLGVLIGSYLVFRRDPAVDLRANMLFMLGLTVINILTDLTILSYQMSWIAFGALLVWSMAGGGRSR